jgi:hypothetical protein
VGLYNYKSEVFEFERGDVPNKTLKLAIALL